MKDVYNMDETTFILSCLTKQDTKTKEKFVGVRIKKDRLTLALVVNTIR